MIREKLHISEIPAVIWGKQSDKVIVAVHGNMSHKEDTVIWLLAEKALEKGYQVLSFDLHEHGERQDQPDVTRVETYIKELTSIMEEAKSRWQHISLFACSMGAYFSLMAYQKVSFEKVLFLSPLISMQALIEGVMQGFGISEKQLEEVQTIETPIGLKLYWPYYCYVKAHPTISLSELDGVGQSVQESEAFEWNKETYILYGDKDEMCPREIEEKFAKMYQCKLQIEPEAEHYFHTENQLAAYKRWLANTL